MYVKRVFNDGIMISQSIFVLTYNRVFLLPQMMRYLLALASSQLATCICIIPSMIVVVRFATSLGMAYYFAHFEIILTNAPSAASVFFMVGLSVDRFAAVWTPTQYHSLNSNHVGLIRIAFSFVLPYTLYIPHCFVLEVCSNNDTTPATWTYRPTDMERTSAWHYWSWCVELFHRLIPCLIIVLLHSLIIYKVKSFNKKFLLRDEDLNHKQPSLTAPEASEDCHSSTTREKTNLCRKKKKRQEMEQQMTNLLIAMVVTFLITNLPAAILALTITASAEILSYPFEVSQMRGTIFHSRSKIFP